MEQQLPSQVRVVLQLVVGKQGLVHFVQQPHQFLDLPRLVERVKGHRVRRGRAGGFQDTGFQLEPVGALFGVLEEQAVDVMVDVAHRFGVQHLGPVIVMVIVTESFGIDIARNSIVAEMCLGHGMQLDATGTFRRPRPEDPRRPQVGPFAEIDAEVGLEIVKGCPQPRGFAQQVDAPQHVFEPFQARLVVDPILLLRCHPAGHCIVVLMEFLVGKGLDGGGIGFPFFRLGDSDCTTSLDILYRCHRGLETRKGIFGKKRDEVLLVKGNRQIQQVLFALGEIGLDVFYGGLQEGLGCLPKCVVDY